MIVELFCYRMATGMVAALFIAMPKTQAVLTWLTAVTFTASMFLVRRRSDSFNVSAAGACCVALPF